MESWKNDNSSSAAKRLVEPTLPPGMLEPTAPPTIRASLNQAFVDDDIPTLLKQAMSAHQSGDMGGAATI
jgi:hypothetical protein